MQVQVKTCSESVQSDIAHYTNHCTSKWTTTQSKIAINVAPQCKGWMSIFGKHARTPPHYASLSHVSKPIYFYFLAHTAPAA